MWLAPIPLKKCRDFLMHKSGKSIKDRYDSSVQYDFEDIKTSIVKNVLCSSEFSQLFPDCIKVFDPGTMDLFLEESLKLNGITPGVPDRTKQFMDLSEQFKIDMSCYGSIARYANNSCKNYNAELNHIVQP
ncbi:hypothetical protein CAEBREN_24260 [Caenorhabditis brenneri]|uniref:Uncharacterized protein n=1 Tax=Caenorhabditis brenneri TaxID=135651 RepID=G0NJW5_CAEBE|nr:hypothetical protein CAEBREN_24260 [Caenorhabditis brenneri]